MTQALILSKNRAAQCDTLLRSIEEYHPFDRINILWKASAEHAKSYEILQDLHPNVNFVSEKLGLYHEFKKTILNIEDKKTCLLTDDTIFFLLPKMRQDNIVDNNEVICLSLRLGINTRLQDYQTGRYQAPLCSQEKKENGLILWRYEFYPPLDNYGYPIAMDGVIYNTDFLKSLVRNIECNSLRDWEGQLALAKRFLYLHKPVMSCYQHSLCVNIPANNILPGLHHSNNIYEHPTQMLEKFINGYRIDYHKMDFGHVIGAHQEIKYEWSK